MRFFSKTLDKLKGAHRKTAAVLDTDVRTLSIPGRQIDESFLTEVDEKLLQSDMGVRNVDKLVGEIRERWRLGKIRNADEAQGAMRETMLGILPAGDTPQRRELRTAAPAPTVILVAGINAAGKTTSIAKLAWLLNDRLDRKLLVAPSDAFR